MCAGSHYRPDRAMAGLFEKWYRARRNAEGGRMTKKPWDGSRPQLKRKRPAAAGALDHRPDRKPTRRSRAVLPQPLPRIWLRFRQT
jgi:hypothetical protein